MISNPRVPSRIERERTEVRSKPVESTLSFILSRQRNCVTMAEIVHPFPPRHFERESVKTPLMVREPHHERVVQLARSSTLTDRPGLSRRALVGFSRSLRQREILDSSRSLGMTTSCLACRHTAS